jgi:tetratricopeptide (TPR) repeat protein
MGHGTASDLEKLQELRGKLNQNPKDAKILVRLGVMLFEPFHQTEEAIANFEKAIEVCPSSDDAYFWLAKCYFHEYVDLQRAKESLEKGLEINSERADCLSLLSSVLTDLGHAPEDYIAYIRRAIQLAPDWIIPRQQLALTLLKMGRFDEAELSVKDALSVVRQVSLPADPVEEYYELAVTGRGRETALAELSGILKQIDETKSKKSFLGRLLSKLQ